MANYLFLYSGGKGVATEEAERNAQYARWAQWFDALGSAVVDGGTATGATKTVGPGGSLGVSGYSVVTARSLESAVELAKGCPVLEVGGAVDVCEAIAM